ncbi:hypothetical protein GJ496_002930 [Pomphorhynchus laevis]|nr:hypothetical protein GJ496_002930 [Pomphorhynchus laevis]
MTDATTESKIYITGEMEIPDNADRILSGSKWSLNSFAKISPTEWYNQQKNSVRSWLDFFNTARFQVPQTPRRAGRRLIRNVEYFQANYLVIFVILGLYCVITSPSLLLVIGFTLGLCYYISKRNQRSRLVLLGREIPLVYQYIVVLALSIPLFILIGATKTLFWLLGATLTCILLHSIFYTPLQSDEEFERVEVTSIRCGLTS